MQSPPRRAALAVCVALLLVVAGCNGTTSPNSTATTPTTGTATSTTTTTTSTTTTTGTWSPNAPAELHPPGVAANGTLTNITALLDAHFEETANQPLVFTSEWTRPDEHVVRHYAHGASRTPYYSKRIRTTDESQDVTEYYQRDSTGFLRLARDNQTAYTVTQNTTVYGNSWLTDGTYGPRLSLRADLMTGNYSVNGTVERDGQTFVQLTADEPSPSGKDSEITAYEGTVLVTPNGAIYNADESFVQERDGTTEPVESSKTLDTGDWPGKPSWVATLPHLSLSIVEDGHALEIRNTGGAVLPANTTFEVYGHNTTRDTYYVAPGENSEASGTVTTNARLEPGDAVYVTADADGTSPSFTLHDEPTRGNYTFGAAKIHRWGKITYSLVTGVKND